ncbi:MAG: selenocysteine-specific translation elongation factor [bacterium]
MFTNRFRAPRHLPSTLNVMIGVAGHIDHGKTELVKVLTGCDTDRLKEEKERGMSIELGYAPCQLASERVGIVDVPGHERFVRKMVAGATGIDMVLLVIAADDGVMPQTYEHLDIVDLLGVRHALIAITKTDLVSAERVEEVCAEAREFLEDTAFKDAPVIAVSSMTGQGLDVLRQRMTEIIRSIQRRKTSGVFRVPIDRIFSARGHGVVITGIAVSGSVKSGDTIEILPIKKSARVRGLQVFLGDAEEGVAGQCVALNLTHIRPDELERGFVAASPGRFDSHTSYTVQLKASRFIEKSVRNAAQIRFHSGTSETTGKIRLLEGDEVKAGETTFAQIELSQKVTAFLRDRFILRLETPPRTIAGGIVLECGARRHKRRHEPVLNRLRARLDFLDSDADLLRLFLEEDPFVPKATSDLALLSGLQTEDVETLVKEMTTCGTVLCLDGKRFLSASGLKRACDVIQNTLRKLHQAHPNRYGFSGKEIRERTGIDTALLNRALSQLTDEGRVLASGDSYRSADAPDVKPEIGTLAKRVESILLKERFQTSSPAQLAETLRESAIKIEAALKYLTETGAIRRLTETVYLHQQHVQWAQDELVKAIRRDGSFETHKFKSVIGSSRKYAIPLLDYFDGIGLTRRAGGVRYLCEKAD